MKNILLLLLGAVVLTGCMHRYDITLANGMKITHVTRPKFDKEAGIYTYKDIRGRKKTITAARVVEIAPHTAEKSLSSSGSPPVTPH